MYACLHTCAYPSLTPCYPEISYKKSVLSCAGHLVLNHIPSTCSVKVKVPPLPFICHSSVQLTYHPHHSPVLLLLNTTPVHLTFLKTHAWYMHSASHSDFESVLMASVPSFALRYSCAWLYSPSVSVTCSSLLG